MSEYRNLKLRISGNRADVYLNRPGKHNALNPAMIEELHDALSEWR
jgi:methylglutaconyl-CoA hydratase